MVPYPPPVEDAMRCFCASLREKDRRSYAAVEAAKLGHGGLAYIARLLRIDRKTIRRGRAELRHPPATPGSRCRKKGAAAHER